MRNKIIAGILAIVLVLGIFVVTRPQNADGITSPTESAAKEKAEPQTAKQVSTETTKQAKVPKYVFFFIGDGMSHVQANAARVYKGNNTIGEVKTGELNFTSFPINGIATTYDSTSFCPDSASTATSFSAGIKTHSGVIGYEKDKTTIAENISEIIKKNGKKDVGIVSTVTINHATPAAFYAHVPSRNDYYSIAMQMADSNFNYFGGGTISKPTGAEKDQKDAYEVLKEKGYTVTSDPAEIKALTPEADKVYAFTNSPQDSGSMPYYMDLKEGQLSLRDYVETGIRVMSDNEEGFFMMVESGKIDWACHANDAKATIYDTLELEDSITAALDFAKEHPEETLIVVTGDHETGGLTIGQSYTGYGTAFDLLKYQTKSFTAFDEELAQVYEANPNITFEEVMPMITESFGLVSPENKAAAKDERLAMSDYEYGKLKESFNTSKLSSDEQAKIQDEDVAEYIKYGGYNPLSVTITHILNNKAGIGWTSYSHTGTPVAVYAYGAGAEAFSGAYDNTDVFTKFVTVMDLKR